MHHKKILYSLSALELISGAKELFLLTLLCSIVKQRFVQLFDFFGESFNEFYNVTEAENQRVEIGFSFERVDVLCAINKFAIIIKNVSRYI